LQVKIITCNVNGIRAASKKGFWEWISSENPEVICLQEVRATEEQFLPLAGKLSGYDVYHNLGQRPGYSGVAILSKLKPTQVSTSLEHGLTADEGRMIELSFGDFAVASIYFPSGSANESRQVVKYSFMEAFSEYVKGHVASNRRFVYCGDFNIAHKKIDIKNWQSNQKNSGFLPEERAWMDDLTESLQQVDAFRVLNQNAEEYTWWSNRGQAYAKNVGWRLDYQIVSPALKSQIQSVHIYKKEKFSDHAPFIVTYDF
jgi:exodeoxyribonuclease-3